MSFDPHVNVDALVKQLREADTAYYGEGDSPYTDKDYDAMKDWLKHVSPDNEYLKEVGAEPIEDTHWEKHKHEYPLGSLDKVNSFGELLKWNIKYPVVVQQKLDGISICLTYEDGKLVRAVTRGKNGIGDNITRNVVKMKGVITELPEGFNDQKVVVRGEIVLKHSDFEVLPVEQRGKNPRNTAAGAAKKLTGELCHHLTVIVYDLMNASDLGIITETISNTYLKKLGFPYVVDTNRCANEDELDECIGTMEGNRDVYEYDIDGLVIKNNQMDPNDDWEHPKNKIAYKFEHQASETTLLDIVWEASGERVNPVAILEPVDIAGVTVSKASLHNSDYIYSLSGGQQLWRGCKVEVTRRNDVIPQVERIISFPRIEELKLDMQPNSCPCCGSVVERPINEDGKKMAWFVCTNIACPAKAVKNALKWFEVHECKGIAEKTVELIHEYIGFNRLIDFIWLVEDYDSDKRLLALPNMGESKLKNIREQVKNTRNTTITNFLGGLNISGFGPKSFKKIVDHLLTKIETVTIQDVIRFVVEGDISKIEGFGDKSDTVLKIQWNKISDVAYLLLKNGFNCKTETRHISSSACFAGTSFCFTGSLNTMTRKEAQELIESLGGEFKGSVAKGLSYLVTNTPDSGSSKNKKAIQLGVKIITEDDFKAMTTSNSL